ncbi:hypothetical protein A9R05_39015 (plasmid) [Burkholderia sp. KK1]|nr:hypothetical protein A9R05_39015 [Burkholderia sp. KK1]
MHVQFVNLPSGDYAIATTRRSTNRPPAEALVAGDRDLMKALMKDALREVLEAEMTELLGLRPMSAARREAAIVLALVVPILPNSLTSPIPIA